MISIDRIRKLAGEKSKYAIKVADKEKQSKCSNAKTILVPFEKFFKS